MKQEIRFLEILRERMKKSKIFAIICASIYVLGLIVILLFKNSITKLPTNSIIAIACVMSIIQIIVIISGLWCFAMYLRRLQSSKLLEEIIRAFPLNETIEIKETKKFNSEVNLNNKLLNNFLKDKELKITLYQGKKEDALVVHIEIEGIEKVKHGIKNDNLPELQKLRNFLFY